MATKPRDAATLILLRDSGRHGGGIEVLLLQRHVRSAFLPGAHVFPGGVVERADYTPAIAALCRGLRFDQAQQVIGDVSPPEKSLGFFVAAVRECFEESGILLAHGRCLTDEERLSRLGGYRAKVHADPLIFLLQLNHEGLELAVDRLFYFAHWITPEVLPIRFDARFFVAAAPPGQKASPDGRETVEARWMSPQRALDRHRQGRLRFAPPTFYSLTELAEFRTVDQAIASTRGKKIETRHG